MLADIETLESDDDASELDQAIAMQRLINSGLAWRLQGSYGRAAMAALESGLCMLGTERATDAYGSTIPSRYDVEEGTKGSKGLVLAQMGEDWLEELERA